MNPGRIMAVVLRYYYLLRASPMRVVSLYVWVLIDMVLWGFISEYLNKSGPAGLNFTTAFLGAVLLSDFFARVILGITTTFFEDVWSRNFLNLFASPLRIPEYLAGLVISGVITSGIGLLLMLALAHMIFGLSVASYGAVLVPGVLVLFLTGIALGIVGTSIVLRFGPSSEWLVWPIPAVLAPFVGVFYPIATLPEWMQAVAHALPPSYVFEGLRAVTRGEAVSMQPLLFSMLLALGYILLAGWWFMRVYRRAVRTGLIARYTAEASM